MKSDCKEPELLWHHNPEKNNSSLDKLCLKSYNLSLILFTGGGDFRGGWMNPVQLDRKGVEKKSSSWKFCVSL
jgi:hypothetical protein